MSTRNLVFVLSFAMLLNMQLFSQAPGLRLRFDQPESDFVPAAVLEARRAAITKSHSEKSLIIVLSADVRNRQNDVDYEFRQNSNLLYLSGSTQPNTALVLVPGSGVVDGQRSNEFFFVADREPQREVWIGTRMGPEEVRQYLGFQHIIDYARLSDVLDSLLTGKDTLFIASGMPTGTIVESMTKSRVSVEQSMKDAIHAKHPDLYIRTTLPDMSRLREIKDENEIRLLRKAIDISVSAHTATMQAAKPGMKEYELEAIMEYGFKKAGAEDVGYPSIVGSGYNACILHYQSNRKTTQLGDMILADCGAEYHGYTADITRTFPVNGHFTPEQRAIYDIVLEAQDSGIAACRAGNSFRASHKAAMAVVQRRLLDLGVTKDSSQTHWYFMHGTSHYLGLDVHDAGTGGALKAGVVMTVEPGIYIPEGSPCERRFWNIGVRIEDDILVTDGQPINLSGALVRRAEDIERIMSKAE